MKHNHFQIRRLRSRRCLKISQQRVRQAVKPNERNQPGPEFQRALFFNNFVRQIFLRCRPIFPVDLRLVFLVIRGDIVISVSDNPARKTASLPHCVPFRGPIIYDVKIIIFWIGKQIVERIYNQHIEVEIENPLTVQTSEVFEKNAVSRLKIPLASTLTSGMGSTVISLSRPCSVSVKLKLHLTRCVGKNHIFQSVHIIGFIKRTPLDTNHVYSLHRCNSQCSALNLAFELECQARIVD